MNEIEVLDSFKNNLGVGLLMDEYGCIQHSISYPGGILAVLYPTVMLSTYYV